MKSITIGLTCEVGSASVSYVELRVIVQFLRYHFLLLFLIDLIFLSSFCNGNTMVLPDEEPVKDDEDHLEKDVIVVDDDSSGEEDDHFLTTIVSSKFKNSN
ncbi:hypothetical protein L1987_68931 [Smallanthus sonchifolius]|uniref:Uncharacterized protein n=1 Tax=Smallanthus sonchifolius TaxID=185202 RepID=A0ACB9B4B7_9ASTR|nr:hypothetical protein L1987_68931 [Smallanthus sonchifolius]